MSAGLRAPKRAEPPEGFGSIALDPGSVRRPGDRQDRPPWQPSLAPGLNWR